MTGHIDLNADIGEAETDAGIAAELSILTCVSSANIACGGHRGDMLILLQARLHNLTLIYIY